MDTKARSHGWVLAAVSSAAIAVINLTILWRIAHREGPAAMFCDDFFYYAVAARNYLHVGFTTFDGQTHTNGYHPAWMVLLTLIMSFSGGRFLYVALLAMCALLAVATFLVTRLLERLGMSEGGSLLCALVTIGFMMPILGRGMEVTLVAPLLLGFCLFAQDASFDRVRTWFVVGLLGSLLILSRIDAILFMALYLAHLILLERRSGRLPAKLLATGLGLLPSAAYFLYNRIVFGAWMTVSSMAKELRTTHVPSLLPLHGSFLYPKVMLYITSLLGAAVFFAKGSGTMRRPLASAALLFPFVQLITLCFVSDWPLEPWYSYGLVVSFPVAVCLLLQTVEAYLGKRLRISAPAGAVVGLLFFVVLQDDRFPAIPHDAIGAAANQIATWSSTHPGRTAMGDRAGKVGWDLDPAPLQLEGLMTDVPFLQHLRNSENLISVLKEQGVRYYIATDLVAKDGCYQAFEPMRAGSTTHKMHGEFCSQPVFTYIDAPLPGEPPAQGPGVRTMIFDVQREQGAKP